MKKVDTKQWLEAETKKVISDTKKYNCDRRYKKELDYAVIKKILLMIPLIIIILGSHMEFDLFGHSTKIKTNGNTFNLFPNVWVCPKASCG